MKKKALIIILITLIAPITAADQVFHVELTVHDNDTAQLENINTFEGQESDYYGEEGDYRLKLIDSSGENIWEQKRSINWMLMTNPPTPINTTPISLNMPYSKEAKTFKLEKKNKTLLEIELTDKLCKNEDNQCTPFCEGKGLDSDCTCGDGICQESANEQETCPQDCSEPEEDENEDQEDQDTNRTSDGTEEVVDSSYSNYLIILIAVLAVVIGLFMLSGKIKIEA